MAWGHLSKITFACTQENLFLSQPVFEVQQAASYAATHSVSVCLTLFPMPKAFCLSASQGHLASFYTALQPASLLTIAHDPAMRPVQAVVPETRTYNTIINACNRSGQPDEGYKVYERMLREGAVPSATTYTALISAYGKIGKVGK